MLSTEPQYVSASAAIASPIQEPATPQSVRLHSLTIDFVPVQEYEIMKERYNAVYQTDMLYVGKCDYDGVDTWIEAARPLMKQPPWGQIKVSGECLEEIKEIGNLAQVDSSRLGRAIGNSVYIPSLISKIDQRIAEHRQETNSSSDKPIFCRTNECSMKQSTSYKVRPFTNGAEIMDQLLRDRRLISWLAMEKHNIKSTNIYLSDFDDAFASKNEYRVFIWKGRVTGISQYRWFQTDETEYHTQHDALQISEDIVHFIEGPNGLIYQLRENRRNKRAAVANLGSNNASSLSSAQKKHDEKDDDDEIVLVADVVHTNGQVYLVEINLFGGETGCGSSLFHWKRDEGILYSDGQNIICRFLSRSCNGPEQDLTH